MGPSPGTVKVREVSSTALVVALEHGPWGGGGASDNLLVITMNAVLG